MRVSIIYSDAGYAEYEQIIKRGAVIRVDLDGEDISQIVVTADDGIQNPEHQGLAVVTAPEYRPFDPDVEYPPEALVERAGKVRIDVIEGGLADPGMRRFPPPRPERPPEPEQQRRAREGDQPK